MDILTVSLNSIDNALSVVRTNPYVSSVVSLFLVLYAGMAAPALPARFAGLFEHSSFKLMILFLVLLLLKNNNPTTALLVAIGFTVSLNTLSKYRVFTMANDLSGLVSSESQRERSRDNSYGPDGLATEGSIEEAEFQSNGNRHQVKLRGHKYSHDDEANLVPGGHGDMDANNNLQSSAALHPNNMYQGPQGMQLPTGYESGLMATIGGDNSQL